ncbi:MAG: alpha/beta hydrolase domain-containing protein [Paludibaculum sp.]
MARFSRLPVLLVLFGLFTAGLCPQAAAKIVRIAVEERESPAFGGKDFGAGPYERLSGQVFGELDPSDPRNAIITDLQFAPRNARGMVEYSATFTLLRPIDAARASGVLIYDVPNRGSRLLLGAIQGGEPGDGFLFRRGHAILASGWQGDVLPRSGVQSLIAPVAKNPDGSSITGPVLVRFSDLPAATKSIPVTGLLPRRPYLAASLDPAQALLTKRGSEEGAATPLDSRDWAFADCTSQPFPGVPDAGFLCLKQGFEPGQLYELTYIAKDPLVLGIGFAATRDTVAFFRREAADAAGGANPMAGRIGNVIAVGISQSGNFVKSFIHLGFNQDENGRRVWDGADDHIAARQTPLNFRFAVPGGSAGMYEPGSEAALWWADSPDPVRGRATSGMLHRCSLSATCPKIFETFGSAEFWGLKMSPGLVGTDARADIPLPPQVRRYYFPGTTHGGGRGGFKADAPAAGGRCVLPDNPNPQSDSMRALLDALVQWVARDVEPPPSRYPRLDLGQLVRAEHGAMGYPVIPGRPLPDQLINTFYDYDLGAQFQYNDLSGVISLLPPVRKQIIPGLVPKVDADGNELSGVSSVQHQVPLGTYLGWNVTAGGFQQGRGCGFIGGFVPFAPTRAQRLEAGDPRPSLEERYPTHESFVDAVRAASERLVRDRFLLKEDADRLIREAAESTVRR